MAYHHLSIIRAWIHLAALFALPARSLFSIYINPPLAFPIFKFVAFWWKALRFSTLLADARIATG